MLVALGGARSSRMPPCTVHDIGTLCSTSLCQAAWLFVGDFGAVTCFRSCIAMSSAVRQTQFTTSLVKAQTLEDQSVLVALEALRIRAS